MTEERAPLGVAACCVALWASMAGGTVLACSWFVAVPHLAFIVAATGFSGGILTLTFVTYLDSRATGIGYRRSLGKALRDGGRVLLDFFP